MSNSLNPITLYFNRLGDHNLLTRDEERELVKRKEAGDEEAVQELIKANLRLVVSIAKKWANDENDLMDLIGAGNEGLIKGIKKFSSVHGTRISTYATYWIKQSIMRHTYRDRTIAIPDNVMEKYLRDRRNGEDTSDWDVIFNKPASISTSIGEEEGMDLESVLACDKIDSPDKVTEEKMFNEAVYSHIERLPDREREIVTDYYGFNGRNLTLEQIGNKHGLSRERIRQILVVARERLQALMTDGKELNVL